MNVLKGRPICGGIAIGTALNYRQEEETLREKFAQDGEKEREKYAAVRGLAIDELDRLFKKTQSEVGEKEAQIFSIHKMMVEDMYYNESVLNIIEKQKMNAETAVLMTSNNFERLFNDMDSAYMRERASDIRDVSDRIVSLLRGKKRALPQAVRENTIIFARNLTPSETVQLDKTKIAAFVTEVGNETSHTAILARSLKIPAVAGVKAGGKIDGRLVAIDGYNGLVYIEPDSKTVERLKKEASNSGRQAVKGAGRKGIKLMASISAPEEVKTADFCLCDGIGMFKSELLFRNGEAFPSEEYQFDAYRKALAAARELTVRTLDLDPVKKGNFFGIFGEENPAMGMRAIRLCLKYPNIFKPQLRAVLKASACGRVRILLPMITAKEELLAAKKLLDEAKAELRAEKREFDEKIALGVMIDTPAASVISDGLAKNCDFFLIDADRLTQLTLAMDRKNIALAELFDCRHSAVMRLIEIAVKNARKNGITVGIYGEIAGDREKIPELLKMGITEFTANPKNLLKTAQALAPDK